MAITKPKFPFAIIGRKEGNVLVNDALNTFYLRLYGVGHMVKDHSDSKRGNLLPHSFQLAVRAILYAPSHRQDTTYHSLWYTSRGALAGMRNISMGEPWRIDPTTHRNMSERSYHGATSRSFAMILSQNECLTTSLYSSSAMVEHPLMVQWLNGLIPRATQLV